LISTGVTSAVPLRSSDEYIERNIATNSSNL
jgi:hypothetical protein